MHTLTSFKLCPYAQMALIICQQHKLTPTVNNIDPSNPPQWFKDISPTGNVPMLQIDDTIVFESLVIAQYFDTLGENSLLPADSVQKAVAQSWMSFAANLIGDFPSLISASSEEDFDKVCADIKTKFAQIAKAHSGGDFFLGEEFSLVDVAFAPFFMRLSWINDWTNNALDLVPESLKNWQNNILSKTCVINSVASEIEDIYMSRVEQFNGILASKIVDE